MSDSLWPHGLYSPWNSPGKNTGAGTCSLFQGIFSTQGSNSDLPHCRRILYQLSHKGSPWILEWVAYPFSSGSSWPRNWTGVSCIAGGFFTNWAIRETPKRNGIQMQSGLINQRTREGPSALASWVSLRDWWEWRKRHLAHVDEVKESVTVTVIWWHLSVVLFLSPSSPGSISGAQWLGGRASAKSWERLGKRTESSTCIPLHLY